MYIWHCFPNQALDFDICIMLIVGYRTCPQVQPWLYGYDAYKEVDKAIEREPFINVNTNSERLEKGGAQEEGVSVFSKLQELWRRLHNFVLNLS